jgi:PIN domain nuclease of toxin-antitoxin system
LKILLDTHVWLWLQTEPDRLSDDALGHLHDATHDLYLSAASGWEIAIKHALGKLPLPEPPARYVPSRLETSGVSSLPVEMRHALHVSGLPSHHQDPFDRLLVAQAQLEGMHLMTVDSQLEPYEIDILAARG